MAVVDLNPRSTTILKAKNGAPNKIPVREMDKQFLCEFSAICVAAVRTSKVVGHAYLPGIELKSFILKAGGAK